MLPSEVKPYHTVSAELTVQHGLLLRGSRIVKKLLDKIHSGHQGITKSRELARQSIWWPGLSKQLEDLIHNCERCLKAQRQRPQPLNPTALPSLPWQKVASDLFEWNQSIYLLVVDYYSRYIEIARLSRPTTAEVVTHLKSIFARHGIPETLVTSVLLKRVWGIRERLRLSPHHVEPLPPPRKWRGRESSWDNKESAEERGRSLQVPTGLSFNAATSRIQSLSTPNGAGPPYKCSNHQSSAETSSSGPHLRADKRPEEQTKTEEKLRFSSWGKRIATTTLRRSCLGPREKE